MQLFGLFAGGQCVDQLVQIAVHDLGKIVHGQADAVVGAAVLREVVGADLFNNVITTYVPEDGIMKRDAVQKSSQCYLVMESNKFDFKANYVYATFNDIEGVICERELSEEIKKKLEEYQTKII